MGDIELAIPAKAASKQNAAGDQNDGETNAATFTFTNPAATSKKEGPATQTAIAPDFHVGKKLYVSNWFSNMCLIFQVAMVVLYGTCTVFEGSINSTVVPSTAEQQQLNVRYSMFQDTHVMMLLGFGFLYTLLRRYAWTGVGWNYIMTVVVIQWATLCLGFWVNVRSYRHASSAGSAATGTAAFPPIPLNIDSLINADYVAATILISFGAVIGRVSATQMLVMALIEAVGATANVVIGMELAVTDPGGSMLIHCYGAAFGLALAYSLGDAASNTPGGEEKLGTSRHNGTFAMIGTLFLFCFWPSFNAGLLVGAAQHRAVINTVLSICASAVTAFAVSKSVHNGKRFDMEHIQNATLAGGVAIGASCDMLFNSFGAILTGSVAGIVSSYGFSFLAPILKRNGLTDICGIAHLHLMPGIIGGVASAIAAAGITTSNGEYSTAAIDAQFPGRSVEGRSAIEVGGYQMAMTVISLTFGASLGWITGKIIQWPFAEPMVKSFYEDGGAWNVPYDEEETPELDEDVARELANINARMDKQRSEIVELVFSHLSASGIELNSTLVSQLINRTKGGSAAGDVQDALTSKDVPSSISSSKSSDAGVVQLQAAAKARQAQLQRMQTGLSANTRFLEGSFHGGVAGGAGTGSTHGSPNYQAGQGAGASPRHDSSNHSRAHKAITGELSAHGGRFAGHQ